MGSGGSGYACSLHPLYTINEIRFYIILKNSHEISFTFIIFPEVLYSIIILSKKAIVSKDLRITPVDKSEIFRLTALMLSCFFLFFIFHVKIQKTTIASNK